MPLSITFPPATLEKLQAQSAACGKDVETFVREAVEAKLVVSALSLSEILAPIHEEIEASGMTEEEIDALAEAAVARARSKRKSFRNGP